MSLSNQLTNDNYGITFYTQDEEELLRSMEPSQFITQDNRITEERLENTQQLNEMNDELNDYNVQGGSIIATLASIGIPLLVKNMPQIIGAVKNLFRRKKTGGSDTDITMDMIKEALENQDKSKYEIKGGGKEYVRNIIKNSEKMIKDVLKYHNVPVNSYEIKQELGIPKSFRKILKSKKGSGKSSNKQYIDPLHVVKWSMRKMFNNDDVYRNSKPLIKSILQQETSGGSFKGTLKNVFMKTKSFMKKLPWDKILNGVKSISNQIIPTILPQIDGSIDKIFNRINTSNPTTTTIKNIAQEGIKSTSKSLLTEDNINKLISLIENKTRGDGIINVGGSNDGSGIHAIKQIAAGKKKVQKPIHFQIL